MFHWSICPDCHFFSLKPLRPLQNGQIEVQRNTPNPKHLLSYFYYCYYTIFLPSTFRRIGPRLPLVWISSAPLTSIKLHQFTPSENLFYSLSKDKILCTLALWESLTFCKIAVECLGPNPTHLILPQLPWTSSRAVRESGKGFFAPSISFSWWYSIFHLHWGRGKVMPYKHRQSLLSSEWRLNMH